MTFTDSSTNSPTSWSWTFGDSDSSTAQNPSHTYTAAGSYTVALTATNAYGNNTNTKTNYITVGNAPVANFSGTPTSGTAPLSVTFTDSSTNSPDLLVVDLRGQQLLHRAEPEPHLQRGRQLHGCAHRDQRLWQQHQHEDQLHHRYRRFGPGGQLLRQPDLGPAPLAVSFSDSSTNTPTSWSWAFGDSSTSTAQNPSHTYSSAGNYTVALTATNSGGNNTCTKANYISTLAAFYPTACTSAARPFPVRTRTWPAATMSMRSTTAIPVRTRRRPCTTAS